MALLTLAEYKVFAVITNSNADARLTVIINSAESYFLNRIKRIIEKASFTEYYDGDGETELLVKQFPITQFTQLTIDDVVIDTDDYVIYEEIGKIRFKSGSFSIGIKNVKVEYDAGYDPVPNDIKMCVAEIVSRKYQEFDKDGQTFSSESYMGGSIVIKDSDLTDFANDVINKYRNKYKRN